MSDLFQEQKDTFGIDWEKAVANGKDGMQDAFFQVKNILIRISEDLSESERYKATELGLLTKDGEISVLRHGVFPALYSGTSGADDVEKISVFGFNMEEANRFANAKGDDIKILMKNLITGFNVLGKSSSEAIVAKKMMAMGILFFTTTGGKAVYKIIKTLVHIGEEEEFAAIFDGVVEVGINAIKLGVCVVVLAVLVPLFILMEKNAVSIQLLLNFTGDDMEMDGVPYCTHGKEVCTFMQGDDPTDIEVNKPILPAKLTAFKDGVDCSGVYAGLFSAQKKDMALIGTRGAFKFKPTKQFPSGAYVGWSVPLSEGSNKQYVSSNVEVSLSKFSDQADDKGSSESVSVNVQTGAVIQGRVNSKKGSEGYMIFSFKPK